MCWPDKVYFYMYEKQIIEYNLIIFFGQYYRISKSPKNDGEMAY